MEREEQWSGVEGCWRSFNRPASVLLSPYQKGRLCCGCPRDEKWGNRGSADSQSHQQHLRGNNTKAKRWKGYFKCYDESEHRNPMASRGYDFIKLNFIKLRGRLLCWPHLCCFLPLFVCVCARVCALISLISVDTALPMRASVNYSASKAVKRLSKVVFPSIKSFLIEFL